METNTVVPESQGTLIEQVRKDPERLVDRLRRKMVPIVRLYMSDLPFDLREEAVQEAVIKMVVTDTFQPSEQTEATYLHLTAREASRKVRMAYAPPGQPKRTTREQAHIQPLSLSGTDGLTREERHLIESRTIDENMEGTVVARVEAEGLLQEAAFSAPSQVAKALTLVYTEEITLTEAARAVQADRVTLSRQVQRWRDAQGLIAA